ncbi:hypothetical protein [Methanosarcina sp. MSH10X1]|uniref:hypothetical protein n=1 Tax=Methanosarcina sp. MSH10X1 TaxID=2507075 RepID=UPI001F0BDECD|nr:hypothetical protein [Methanosarcina sp. MSH10X1]
MNSLRRPKTFLSMLSMSSSLCIGDSKAFPDKDALNAHERAGQGILPLFSQSYSRANGVPNNIFIAKLQGNKIYDRLYSAIYGTLKSEITFDTSTVLKYKVARDSRLFPYSLFPIADTILESGVNGYTVDLMRSSETHSFCEAASIPLIHYRAQPRQSGSLYICGLVPMVKCTYQISMDTKMDDPQSFVELNSPGSKLIIQKIGNDIILKSYFRVSSEDIRSENICIRSAAEKFDFKIKFDGHNKTNTIYTKDGNSIVTPFYNPDRQRLPYIDFSNGYIKLTSFITGRGTHLDVEIYRINQTADRKLITAIGCSRMLPFGLDGPHIRKTTEQGISYLNSKNNRGTIWFDIELLEQCNETDLEYLRSLVINNSWDVGIHYSKELNSLPLEQAYEVIDEGYLYVYNKIGRKPTSWCSMRNKDTVTHAIYAYENLEMFWRNGDSGIHAEKDIGNLDDATWEWWETASRAGMIHPVFTHELDQDPAIKYSISRSKFQNWVENYDSNNISIVSFYEYGQVSRNTYDAYFENLIYTEHSVTFDAYTNGAAALINIDVAAGRNTKVYDNKLKKYISYNIEQDNSITFWVENKHTYNIYLNEIEQ